MLLKLAPDGKCDECKSKGDLEIDHVDGRSWDPAELSAEQRIAKYEAEYEDGVKMRALCRSCNGSDGAANKQPRGG